MIERPTNNEIAKYAAEHECCTDEDDGFLIHGAKAWAHSATAWALGQTLVDSKNATPQRKPEAEPTC